MEHSADLNDIASKLNSTARKSNEPATRAGIRKAARDLKKIVASGKPPSDGYDWNVID